VTGDAELRLVELVELEDAGVNLRAVFFFRRDDVVLILVLHNLVELGSLTGRGHRAADIAGLDGARAVDLGEFVGDAVTGDAGDAFARHFAALPQRFRARFAALRSHFLMATHAEVADRSRRQVDNGLFELMEHRRNRRVSMRRVRPLFVDLGVTLTACRGGRIGALGENLGVRVDRRGDQKRWDLSPSGDDACRERQPGDAADSTPAKRKSDRSTLHLASSFF
jgi:hypothetical protein